MPLTDCIDGLPIPALAGGLPRSPGKNEREVVYLFDQLSDPLLRYTLAFGISVHDAEEVVQEVFLALFRHLELGRSRSNLRGWIFRVGHNLALKRRIANNRERDRMLDSELICQQVDREPNPEEHLTSAQRRRQLLAVFNALPATDQNCLRLRAEGFRYREIASVLGISLGSVSLSLVRSLERLSRADKR